MLKQKLETVQCKAQAETDFVKEEAQTDVKQQQNKMALSHSIELKNAREKALKESKDTIRRVQHDANERLQKYLDAIKDDTIKLNRSLDRQGSLLED
eukprot:764702-Ditylum_brightwellii.AAC.1